MRGVAQLPSSAAEPIRPFFKVVVGGNIRTKRSILSLPRSLFTVSTQICVRYTQFVSDTVSSLPNRLKRAALRKEPFRLWAWPRRLFVESKGYERMQTDANGLLREVVVSTRQSAFVQPVCCRLLQCGIVLSDCVCKPEEIGFLAFEDDPSAPALERDAI